MEGRGQNPRGINAKWRNGMSTPLTLTMKQREAKARKYAKRQRKSNENVRRERPKNEKYLEAQLKVKEATKIREEADGRFI